MAGNRDETERSTTVAPPQGQGELRSLHRALRESEERFRQLADTLPIGLAVHTRGRIVYANRAALRVAGAEHPSELIGRDVFLFVHPDSLAVTQARIATIYAKAGDASWIESRFQRPDGTAFPVEVASFRIDWNGEPAGLVIFNDITRRKAEEREQRQLERRVLEAQHLESLAMLAGGVAHDFNNLLVGILGHAELALMDLPPYSPARTRIEGVQVAARRAAELAQQMLAYSGKGSFVVGALDLQELLGEMVQLLEASLGRMVRIDTSFDAELPPVHGDATQLRQVVMNLMTNAAEAIEGANGRIELATCLAFVPDSGRDDPEPGLPPGRYAVISVTDNGCGMDAATRARIFDPFYTTKLNGRGLGLAAVQGIVAGHKGSLRVSSEPGEGSTFEVLLPTMAGALPAREQVAPPPQPAALPRRPRTVLVVDDDATVLEVAEAMLSHGGFEVIKAAGGHEAVEIFRQRHATIHLVVLDLSMPLMDGHACFEQLRAVDPGLRVLLCSGYTRQDAIERFGTEGLSGFLHKPYRARDLLDAVARALEEEGER